MKCRAMDLADYIVSSCSKENEPVSNLQLQKMLYFLQTVYCRATRGELLFDEEFEAWPYGPVLPEVYFSYSKYGGRAIDMSRSCSLGLPSNVMTFINDGIKTLRRKSPWELVRTSHASGSPWDQVWQNGRGYRSVISNDLIKSAALAKRK